MCTLYNQGKLLRTNQLPADLVAEYIRETGKQQKVRGLRPTDPGVVIARGKEGALRAVPMRWGWSRPGIRTVVNSRDDKLGSSMWLKADRERRCLISAESFCEWSGEKGHKVQHWFGSDDLLPVWIAGLWENHRENGLCYTMVTRSPVPPVAEVHDRMPAVLTTGEALTYLDHGLAANAGTQPLVELPGGCDHASGVRNGDIRPGMKGWAHQVIAHELPPGLEDRTPITVVSKDHTRVMVRTEDGREWAVWAPNCDTGSEYQFDGRWLPESSPGALVYLQRLYRRKLAERLKPIDTSWTTPQKDTTESLVWQLARNGVIVA